MLGQMYGCSIVVELLKDDPSRVVVRSHHDDDTGTAEIICEAWSVDGGFAANGVVLELTTNGIETLMAALSMCEGVTMDCDVPSEHLSNACVPRVYL
jgi:hypothetical protein